MREKLNEAMAEQSLRGDAEFNQVVLVDDFYGSGSSLLRKGSNGNWEGKLKRARDHLESDLQAGQDPLVNPCARVLVVIYFASKQARTHIESMLKQFAPDWQVLIVQPLSAELVCSEPELIELCHWYWDDVLEDRHLRGPAPLGYKGAALPLVLFHNTPNNSISPLWADSTDSAGGPKRHALFRRYERHHADRP